MTQTRRPKTLFILLLFFLWADAKMLESLLFPARSAGYHFAAALGVPWLHVVANGLTAAVLIAATVMLWKPSRGWFRAVAVAFGVYLAQTVIGTAVMARNIEAAISATLISREQRGMPIRADDVRSMMSPTAMWLTTLLFAILIGIALAAAWRRRDYPDAGAGEPRSPDSRPHASV